MGLYQPGLREKTHPAEEPRRGVLEKGGAFGQLWLYFGEVELICEILQHITVGKFILWTIYELTCRDKSLWW